MQTEEIFFFFLMNRKMKITRKYEEKYLEQRATTEFAKGESSEMDLGEPEPGESSSFFDFLR